jgi:hypothetical protein
LLVIIIIHYLLYIYIYTRVFIDDNITHICTSSEWGRIKHRAPQGSILGPILFLLYINDLPKIVNYNAKLVMFADDTSVIVSNPDLENFKNDIISSFRQLDNWFKNNLLSLNYNNTQFIQFRTINSLTVQLDISYNDKYIIHNTNTLIAPYHGSIILRVSRLSWAGHAMQFDP